MTSYSAILRRSSRIAANPKAIYAPKTTRKPTKKSSPAENKARYAKRQVTKARNIKARTNKAAAIKKAATDRSKI